MSAAKPDAALVQRAIDVYLGQAYPDGKLPVTISSMLATTRGYAGEFFKAPTFVKDDPKTPRKYTLRLGNRHYPHMKLVYEIGPDGNTFLFRADSHDAHCCPPEGAPEHAAFRELMENNQKMVDAIEQAWAAQKIPTFKTFLRDDLARRKQNAAAGSPAST